MDMQIILAIIEKNVNVKGLSTDLLTMVVQPALDRAVKRTKTPLDNMAMSLLYPKISEEIVKEIAKYWSKIDGK